MEIRLLKV